MSDDKRLDAEDQAIDTENSLTQEAKEGAKLKEEPITTVEQKVCQGGRETQKKRREITEKPENLRVGEVTSEYGEETASQEESFLPKQPLVVDMSPEVVIVSEEDEITKEREEVSSAREKQHDGERKKKIMVTADGNEDFFESPDEQQMFTEEINPAEKNMVLPERVQVKVKKTTYPEKEAARDDDQDRFDPGFYRIKVVGEDETPEEAGADQEQAPANSGVATSLRGAKVKVGEAPVRRRVAARVQPTQLPTRAIKVRNITGEIVNISTEVIKDKVIIQGIIHKQVFFVSADGVVRHFAEDVPFSTFIDLPGADVGMNVQVHPVIEKILFHLTPDGLFVNQKIILEIFVKVTEFTQTGLTLGEGPLLLLPLVVGEGTKQKLVENIIDLEMPALKVDEIRGELRNIEAEIIPDKVIIQGIIHKQIFYIDLDNLARHQAEEVGFSLFIDLPGVEPGMDIQVHPVIEGIFFELLSPTELRQKVVVEVFVKVTEAVQERVVIGQGPLFKVEEVINQADKQILNETTIELDRAAIKIREIIGEIRNITAQIIPDKVVVQGLLHKQIFYIGTDNIEYHQAEDVPFSLFVDLPGATPGLNSKVTVVIEKIFFDLLTDTTLQQKVILKAGVIVTETLQLPLEIGEFGLFKLEEVIGEGIRQILVERRQEVPPIPPIVRNVVVVQVVPPAEIITERQQIIVENVVKLPETAIKIREVRGEVTGLRARPVTESGILIDGFVHKQVFFVGEDNVVRNVNERVPFSILVNLPGIIPGTPFTVDVRIEKISFTLAPDGNFLRQIIVLVAEVTAELPAPEPFQVVSEVTGPGVTTERVLVRAPVLTETGVEVEEFFVVTAVSGPGIRRVETAVVRLDIVNDDNPNPVPIEVVTDVEFEPVVFS